MKDLSPLEAGRWMDAAPQIVQDAVTSPVTQQVLNGLSKKYSLHVDVSGLLEKLTSYVLLGYVRPEEFLKELLAAGVSDKDARGIMTELNEKIFVPLRKEEEKGGAVEPRIQPAAPKVGQEPASHFKLENKIPLAHSAPQSQKNEKSDIPAIVSQGSLPPKVFLPRSSTLGEVVRSVLAAPKPLDSNNLLEDHEESHIEINKILVPQNLPGAMPPVEAPHLEEIKPAVLASEVRPSPESPKVEPRIQPAAPTAPVAPKPIAVAPAEPKSVPAPITSYSSDPYREPIDEPPTE